MGHDGWANDVMLSNIHGNTIRMHLRPTSKLGYLSFNKKNPLQIFKDFKALNKAVVNFKYFQALQGPVRTLCTISVDLKITTLMRANEQS